MDLKLLKGDQEVRKAGELSMNFGFIGMISYRFIPVAALIISFILI